MVKKSISNDILHIMPFDSGIVFFDELSMNNKDSFKCINAYVDLLETKIKPYGFELFRNITVINDDSGYKFNDKIMCAEAVCYIKLVTGVYCYLLQSGIGIILCADFDSSKFDPALVSKISKFSQCLQLGYRKVYGQKVLLGQIDDKNTFKEEKVLIKLLLDAVWETTSEISKLYPKKYIRKKTSNKLYKHYGLSYILSIYLIDRETISDDELHNLMYSSTWNQVLKEENWSSIDENVKKQIIKETNELNTGNYQIHFSWTGLAIVSDNSYTCFRDVLEDGIVSNVVKAENYVQSRWFLGDGCLDNFKLENKTTLENVVVIQNELEFIQAELENKTSANMTTFYKEVTSRIIETSEIKSLYSSVIRQIKVQANLTKAKIEDSKRRSLFISSILVAIFTAFSMYKAINEFINGKFDVRNIVLFVSVCVLAFGLVVFEYFNNKRG